MPDFPDHFSQTAAQYASYRPVYPAALFEWLANQSAERSRAWDCGTGNGQAALELAKHFDTVIATDPSHPQLIQAKRSERIHYAAMTAEASALQTASVQVVTVAQALHWFDLARFYPEVLRVLVQGGVIAVWSYGLLTIDPELDSVVRSFYKDEVGQYWPAERALVDAGYSRLEFPFREISVPTFAMYADWTLEQFIGYVSTWSAVTRFRAANGFSPVDGFADAIRHLWGTGATRRVNWPLEVRAGLT